MRHWIMVLLIVIMLIAHASAFAEEWYCEYGPNRDEPPWLQVTNKGAATSPVIWKMIYVRFSTTAYSVNRTLLQSTCESLFSRQSGGLHNVRCDVVTSPDGTQSEWVVPQVPFFESSGDYGDASNVLQHGDFLDCWAIDGRWSQTGELLARVLAQIQASYDAYNGGPTSTWTSPLAGGDAVMFVVLPDSEFPPGESRDVQNPIESGSGVGGIGGLTVLAAAGNVNVVKILNGAPRGASGYLYGTLQLAWSDNNAENSLKMCHEWGHTLGLDDQYPRSTPDLPSYFGAYSLMRGIWNSWGLPTCPLVDHPCRVQLGWLTPVVVQDNQPQRILRDVRVNHEVLKVPVRQTESSHLVQPLGADPFTVYAEADEYFLIAYEDGVGGVAAGYGAADHGLFVWHCIDFGAGLSPGPVLNPTFWDLEVSSGKFDNPGPWPGTWNAPNPISGYDSLDDWPGRTAWAPSYLAYVGQDGDLFDIGENTRFAFDSNPSSWGYAAGSAEIFDGMIGGFQRMPHNLPQSVATSISVDIVGSPSDGLGGVLLDVGLAPSAAVLAPNGGEELVVGVPYAITWSHDEVVGPPANGIINLVDITYLPGGGRTEVLVASGIDAALASYQWTPTPEAISTTGRIRIASHNVNSTTIAPDESDGTFTVDANVAKYVDVSSGSGLDYAGTPYAAATLDFNGDNRGDLLVTSVGDKARLYAGDEPGLDPDAPRFAPALLPGVPPQDCRGVAIGDFDNDGNEDIFLTHDASPKLYRNEVDHSFTDVTSTLGLDVLADHSTAACWVDVDRDGWLDLYVVRSGAVGVPACSNVSGLQHRLFRNALGEGDGFVDITSTSGLSGVAELAALSVCATDIDGDRDIDLFVPRASAWPGGSAPHSLLLVNDGTGHFADATVTKLGSVVASCPAAEFADMDNDNDADLVVANDTGSPWVLLNDGNGSYLSGPKIIAAPEGHSGLKVIDQDLDGRLDVLLLARDANHSCRLFTSCDDGSFLDTSASAGLQTQGPVSAVVTSDFGNDGDADLFLGKPSLPSNQFLFRSGGRSGSANLGRNYVKIKLESEYCGNNRAGIGARVTVTAGALVQTLSPDGGSGRGSQGDRTLVFGLGDSSGPVSAKVHWPGGWITEVASLTISNATSGETVNVIADDTSPTVSDVFAASLADPNTGNLIWQFTWETDVSCDFTKDIFLIDQAGLPIPCLPGWGEINHQSGLTHVYQAKATGGYTHKFLEVSEPCTLNCRIRYSATSAAGTRSSTSPVLSRRILVCPSQN